MATNDPGEIIGPSDTLTKDQEEQASSANPAADLDAKHLEEVLAWQVDYRKAAKDDRPTVMKQRPSYSEYFAKFRELADKHPKTPIEASALGWMAIHAPNAEDKSTSLTTLVDNHCDAELAMIWMALNSSLASIVARS